jgi:hypothetical protein
MKPLAQKQQGRVVRDCIDVGCVLHGNAYDWTYAERLYNMVGRHMPLPVQFHVWTEADRPVPPHMHKHNLTEWPGLGGPRKSWWYKIQLFNSAHFAGDLLYFDLDVVICNDISWVIDSHTDYFWTLRDFRYLQKPTHAGMNSSMMWWNTQRFDWVWNSFVQQGWSNVSRRWPGDQDFLNHTIPLTQKRFFEDRRVQSWRWALHDGGWDFCNRRPRRPGTGTQIPPECSVAIFHGKPKPHQIADPAIVANWL